MFFPIFVFMFLVQLGHLDPTNCYEATQTWDYDRDVQITGYYCPVYAPVRSRQR